MTINDPFYIHLLVLALWAVTWFIVGLIRTLVLVIRRDNDGNDWN